MLFYFPRPHSQTNETNEHAIFFAAGKKLFFVEIPSPHRAPPYPHPTLVRVDLPAMNGTVADDSGDGDASLAATIVVAIILIVAMILMACCAFCLIKCRSDKRREKVEAAAVAAAAAAATKAESSPPRRSQPVRDE